MAKRMNTMGLLFMGIGTIWTLVSNSWRGVKSIHQAYRDKSDEDHPARGDERSGHQMGEENYGVRRLFNRGAGSSFTRFAGTVRHTSRMPNRGVFICFNATVPLRGAVVRNTSIERQPESRIFSSGILHKRPSGGEVRLSHSSIIRIEDEVRLGVVEYVSSAPPSQQAISNFETCGPKPKVCWSYLPGF
ncbi:hypothetical protein B0H13DRAFT_1852369 [Mycena leptocephala]|nr:hypothetical protein B0H13DRAFT_1852369 [Mycena leptocephala]